jgi:hypothetical protein
MTEKYALLEKYLSELPKSTYKIILTFEKIEIILAGQLPPSAYHYKAWWTNKLDGNHAQAHAWLNAGWKIESFDQKRKWVIFHRV